MGVLLNVNVGWQKMGMTNTVYTLRKQSSEYIREQFKEDTVSESSISHKRCLGEKMSWGTTDKIIFRCWEEILFILLVILLHLLHFTSLFFLIYRIL